MKKDLFVGGLLGLIAGAAATYVLGKKAIRKEVESTVLDELDKIERDFDDIVKEYSDLHDYAYDKNESYKQTVKDFYEEREKAKHTDVDATSDDVEKFSAKGHSHDVDTKYNEMYTSKSLDVIEDDERKADIEEDAELFNEFAERMAKEKPLHFVSSNEYLSSPAKEYFDEVDYIFFVKGEKVVDDEWNLQSEEDLYAALGGNWRNVLSKDGVIWAIDYHVGCMYHMTCHHHNTYEEAYDKACSRGTENTIFEDEDERIIGVDYADEY